MVFWKKQRAQVTYLKNSNNVALEEGEVINQEEEGEVIDEADTLSALECAP